MRNKISLILFLCFFSVFSLGQKRSDTIKLSGLESTAISDSENNFKKFTQKYKDNTLSKKSNIRFKGKYFKNNEYLDFEGSLISKYSNKNKIVRIKNIKFKNEFNNEAIEAVVKRVAELTYYPYYCILKFNSDNFRCMKYSDNSWGFRMRKNYKEIEENADLNFKIELDSIGNLVYTKSEIKNSSQSANYIIETFFKQTNEGSKIDIVKAFLHNSVTNNKVELNLSFID